MERTLIFQGAEARVFREKDPSEENKLLIVKERFKKTYRHPDLDAKLTKKRFKGEVAAMQKCLSLGIDTPKVIETKKEELLYKMEFVEGVTLKEFFDAESSSNVAVQSTKTNKQLVAQEMGAVVARIHHVAGLVHGDLTTSNFILRNSSKFPVPNNQDSEKSAAEIRLCAIDFGLAYHTKTVEDRAVDLYVLERALLSTHANGEWLFEQVLRGYLNCPVIISLSDAKKVEQHLNNVRSRGRKKLAFG